MKYRSDKYTKKNVYLFVRLLDMELGGVLFLSK